MANTIGFMSGSIVAESSSYLSYASNIATGVPVTLEVSGGLVQNITKVTPVADGTYVFPLCNVTTRAWITGAVATTNDVGQFGSVAVDDNGAIHIAYYDWTNSALNYASSSDNGSTWASRQIDNTAVTGKWTSIAVATGTQMVNISYYNETAGNARYAYGGSTAAKNTWEYEAIDASAWTGPPTTTCIALDKNGKPFVIYTDYYDTNYGIYKIMSKVGSSWTVEDEDELKDCHPCSITMDVNGRAHAVFHDPYNDILFYINKTGSVGWGTYHIVKDALAICSDLDVATSGAYAFIPYINATSQLCLVNNTGSKWIHTAINSSKTWRGCSCVFNSQGELYILAVATGTSNATRGLYVFDWQGKAINTYHSVAPNSTRIGDSCGDATVRLPFSSHAIAAKGDDIFCCFHDNIVAQGYNLYYGTYVGALTASEGQLRSITTTNGIVTAVDYY